MYKKLYDDGIEECQKRVNKDFGLSYDLDDDNPWPPSYFAYKMAEARMQWVYSLTFQRVCVNVPPRFTQEVDELWNVLRQRGS